MNLQEDTRDPAFWAAIYEAGEERWDLQGPHPATRSLLELGLFGQQSRILVPGAGYGHDALAMAEYGHRVVTVDFAAPAVARVRAEAERRGLSVTARQCDMFSLMDDPAGSFDAVFEYTCFCAIEPAQRGDYRELVTHLVRPGGRLIMFAYPLEPIGPKGPPHVVALDELRALFATGWRQLLVTEPHAAPERRRGSERLVLWERS